jgi:dihydroorotate dehydrogenase
MYSLIKPLLFGMSPEQAHYFAMNAWQQLTRYSWQQKLMYSLTGGGSYNQPVRVAGIDFPNRIGLAAGFDKDARWVDSLSAMGFGHIEVGTLTPRPQPGNARPRLFRLTDDEALINRMGFNNQGVDVACARLERIRSNIIIGGNIGKNKLTPNEKAEEDYYYCFEKLYPHVHYFTVNVSSPNTPDLRELQEKAPLERLLSALVTKRTQLKENGGEYKPVFLKIAPDLSHGQLSDIIGIVFQTGIDGIVATNTTVRRDGLKTGVAPLQNIGAGGLSGKPLKKAATDIISFIHRESGGKFPIIGAGGIFSADDAKEKIDAGASLVQIYTGFIYRGTGLVKEIKKGLAGA